MFRRRSKNKRKKDRTAGASARIEALKHAAQDDVVGDDLEDGADPAVDVDDDSATMIGSIQNRRKLKKKKKQLRRGNSDASSAIAIAIASTVQAEHGSNQNTEDVETTEAASTAERTAEMKIKKKKKKKKKKAATRSFSFDSNEGDGDGSDSGFRVKISKRKRAKRAQAPMATSSDADTAATAAAQKTGAAGRYSKEMMASLRKEQRYAIPSSSGNRADATETSSAASGSAAETLFPESYAARAENAPSGDADKLPDFIPLDGADHQRGGGGGGGGNRERGMSFDGFGAGGYGNNDVGAKEALQHAYDENDDMEWENSQIERGRGDNRSASGKYSEKDLAKVVVEPMSFDMARKSLTESLKAMKLTREVASRQFVRLQVTMKESEAQHNTTQAEYKQVCARQAIYKKLQTFIGALVGCLRAKAPMFAQVEDVQQKLASARSQNSAAVRRNKKLMALRALSSSGALGVMRGAEVTKALARAEEVPTGTDFASLLVPLPLQSQPTVSDALRLLGLAVPGIHEPASSWGEQETDDGEKTKYLHSWASTVEAAQLIFEDVDSQFSSVANILAQFQSWKQEDGKAYRDAYASKSLPELVGPLVHATLLQWDPVFYSGDWTLETFGWYDSLFNYCQGVEGNEGEENIDEEEDRLLPNVIERVALKRLTTWLAEIWDPWSAAQTERARHATEEIIMYEPSETALRTLVSTVLERLKEALDINHDTTEIFLPLVDTSDRDALTVCFAMFRESVKILRNLYCWIGVVAREPLRELASRQIISRVQLPLLTHIMNAALPVKGNELPEDNPLLVEALLYMCEVIFDSFRNDESEDEGENHEPPLVLCKWVASVTSRLIRRGPNHLTGESQAFMPRWASLAQKCSHEAEAKAIQNKFSL